MIILSNFIAFFIFRKYKYICLYYLLFQIQGDINGNLLSVGEISKLTSIPIKILRHYDKMGLLKSVYINKQNN